MRVQPPCQTILVVIPLYNAANFVGKAIDSFLSQTYLEFQISVVDDDSTDDDGVIAAQYAGEKLTLLSQPNSGLGAAMNRAIQFAHENQIAFIARMDADDTWLPEKLAVQLPLFDDQRVGMVFGNVLFGYQGVLQKNPYFDVLQPKSGHIFLSLFGQDNIPMLFALICRHILERVGMFDESIRNVKDYGLFLRVAQVCEFDYVKGPVGVYQLNPHQIRKNFIQAAVALLRVIENAYRLNLAAFQNVDPKKLERGLYHKYLKLALCYLREGKTEAARQTMDVYYGVKGISAIYLAFRGVLSFPRPLMRLIIHLRDKVYQRPKLGLYYGNAFIRTQIARRLVDNFMYPSNYHETIGISCWIWRKIIVNSE